uniref:Leucine-rich repeat-containing N-terminal plant-type domain-containing protein n=1 Tax=Setaria viridis TaxID=4556 RepID=A0A4U6THQ9_SETVI|nr:hypothetical protein SEVIR_8G161950v2 [Setaria viridis]TKW01172.1 hypothetical protein SEVIR_8G161950v2 [Setaria viridis]
MQLLLVFLCPTLVRRCRDEGQVLEELDWPSDGTAWKEKPFCWSFSFWCYHVEGNRMRLQIGCFCC